MVKNDICLGGTSKQNTLFYKLYFALKNAQMPAMFRIGPDGCFRLTLKFWLKDFTNRFDLYVVFKYHSLFILPVIPLFSIPLEEGTLIKISLSQIVIGMSHLTRGFSCNFARTRNPFVIDRISFGRVRSEDIQYCHSWKSESTGS